MAGRSTKFLESWSRSLATYSDRHFRHAQVMDVQGAHPRDCPAYATAKHIAMRANQMERKDRVIRRPRVVQPAFVLSALYQIQTPASAVENSLSEAQAQRPGNDQVIIIKAQKSVASANSISKFIISRTELEQQGDASIVEVLRRVPGMTVEVAPGREPVVRMQGLARYTQILINGQAAPETLPLSSIPPALIEKIEVQRSPTADSSSQASAGVINIVLRSDIPLRTHRVQTTLGNSGLRSAEYAFALPVGKIRFSSIASLSREDARESNRFELGWSTPTHELDRLRTTYRSSSDKNRILTFRPRAALELDGSQTFAVDGLFQHRAQSLGWVDTRVTTLGEPPEFFDDQVSANNRTQLSSLTAAWTRSFEDGAKYEAKVSKSFSRRVSDASLQSHSIDGTLLLDRNVDSVAVDKVRSLRLRLDAPYIARHDLSIGIDLSSNDNFDSRNQNEWRAAGAAPDNSSEAFATNVAKASAFIQDGWEATSSSSTYFGARWEMIRTAVDGVAEIPVRNKFALVSPTLGISYRASSLLSLKGALGRTTLVPRARDLNPRRRLVNDNYPTNPDFQGNPDLSPEKVWTLDFGTELAKKGLYSVAASLSFRRIDDVVLQQEAAIGGRYVLRPMNGGRAKARSIVVDAYLQFPKSWIAGQVASLRFNISRNWSEIDSLRGPRNSLDQQVPLTAGLSFEHKTAGDGLVSGATLNFQQGSLTSPADNRTVKTGAISRLELQTKYRINSQTWIRFAGSNLLRPPRVEDSRYMFDDGAEQHSVSTATSQRKYRLTIEIEI
jgi:outer membrane receptor for ferrienterochelin and colicins